MSDLLEGMKNGVEFAFTLRSSTGIGSKLVQYSGFSEIISAFVLVGFGVILFSFSKDIALFRAQPSGSRALVVITVVLSLFAWRSVPIWLYAFYGWGSMVALLIGVRNGIRLYQAPLVGLGFVLGMLLSGAVFFLLPVYLATILQIVLIGYLCFDTVTQSLSTLYSLPAKAAIVVTIGGTVSLTVFDPDTFLKLLGNIAKTDSEPTYWTKFVFKSLSYTSPLGWLLGYVFARIPWLQK